MVVNKHFQFYLTNFAEKPSNFNANNLIAHLYYNEILYLKLQIN